MGSDGISWILAVFCGFHMGSGGSVRSLLPGDNPVDKSVTRESLPLESGKFAEHPFHVVPRRRAELLDVQEVGVRDDNCYPFPNPAVGDEATAADRAAPAQDSRRDCEDIEAAE